MSRPAMHSTLSLVALAVAAAACTRPAGPRALLDVPVTGSEPRDPAELNARIAMAAGHGLDWPQDPVAVARRFAGWLRSWRCWPDRGHETFGTEPCS